MTNHSTTLRYWIGRHNAGDPRAANELLRYSQDRFLRLIRSRLRSGDRVRWVEESSDVLVGAQERFARAMKELRFATLPDFLRVGAQMIHRQILDFVRTYYVGKPARPGRLPDELPADGRAAVAEEHVEIDDAIASLSPDHRELFDLRYYMGLSLAEAADVLGVPLSTLKRRWVEARLTFLRAYRRESLAELQE
jgi:RNA polymerase sigma factor (sigma-70 family)